ncbi:unnamed protein product, partial [marine sediment metagenome]
MSSMSTRKVFECLSTKKRSHYLLDVLPNTLTLDPNYAGIRGKSFTLFREIRAVPFRERAPKEMQKLLIEKQGSVKMDRSQFLLALQAKFESVIEKNWKPELNHIHLHSSGRDSRIISWTIKSLLQKHGPDWLGRMVFLCSKQEGPSFKKIMEYEGWKKNQYLIIGEELNDEDVWTPILLDFKNAWRMSNGTFTSAVNMWTYFPKVAHQKLGFPLDNIQMWNGGG